MVDIIIVCYNNNKIISSSTYYENNIDSINNELDYCLICDQLNYNKYLINHCKLCNKCHVKNKLHCIYCKQCYNINFNNDNDIIRHKKQCIDFKRFLSY
mgnify:FL=1